MQTRLILVLSILLSVSGFVILSVQAAEPAAASNATMTERVGQHSPIPILQITLEGLEKTAGCFSSRYVVTSTEAFATSISYTFLDSLGNSVHVSVTTIPALGSQAIDLAAIPALPSGYSGKVVISANRSITATLAPPSSVSGRIADAQSNPLAGVSINTFPATSHSTTSDSNGDFTLTGLPPGTCNIAPTKSGYTFSPSLRTVTIPPSASGQNFLGSQIHWTYLPLVMR